MEEKDCKLREATGTHGKCNHESQPARLRRWLDREFRPAQSSPLRTKYKTQHDGDTFEALPTMCAMLDAQLRRGRKRRTLTNINSIPTLTSITMLRVQRVGAADALKQRQTRRLGCNPHPCDLSDRMLFGHQAALGSVTPDHLATQTRTAKLRQPWRRTCASNPCPCKLAVTHPRACPFLASPQGHPTPATNHPGTHGTGAAVHKAAVLARPILIQAGPMPHANVHRLGWKELENTAGGKRDRQARAPPAGWSPGQQQHCPAVPGGALNCPRTLPMM